MSGSGLLAIYVATDAVVSTPKWYTFMCASDEALAAYRWRMKFNGRLVFTITLCVKPSFAKPDCRLVRSFKAFFLLA